MGITAHSVRRLIAARRGGTRFDATVTLGRLEVHPSYPEIEAAFAAQGLSFADAPALPPMDERWRSAEPLFALLGAKRVDSLDASDFEGATVVHDLNRPAPPELWGRYDVVYDGGTLEHVFHVPEALATCMRMVRVGGRVILDTPGNDWMGHGFYQFSPELFFRIFSQANGFAVERITAYEAFPQGRHYEVIDPQRVGRRGEIRTRHRLQLFVEARKVAEVEPPIAEIPQQSFFASQWSAGKDGPYDDELAKRERRERLHRTLARWLAGHPALLRWVEARVEELHTRNKGLRGRRAFCRPLGYDAREEMHERRAVPCERR